MADTPLAGLNIVVTRPKEQAAPLRQRIEQLGGHVLLFPLLEISPPQDLLALQQAIARLSEFDLAIFISPNAVRFAMSEIKQKGGLPSELKVATVGQGSSKTLRDLGVMKVIAPLGQGDSEALLALPELQHVQGWKVAIFRGDGGRELLGDTLKQRGAAVEYVTCYQRSKPQQNIQQLLESKPQAITLSSSEALTYLGELLEKSGQAVLHEAVLFVSHERIAASAKKQGWQHIYQSAAGDEGVIAALIAWAKKRH
jgi:uroporphyrinogen-III synthase